MHLLPHNPAAVSVSLTDAPAPMCLVLFAWLATVGTLLSHYKMWLACWVVTCWPCLTQLALEIRESRAADTIVLYPRKWTNTPPAHQLTRQGSMGLIVGHYLHKYLHQVHQN